MKICLVHHEYPEETSMGGIATYQKLLAKALVSLGNEVTVIAAAREYDQDYYEDGIHIIRYNKCIQYDTIPYMKKYRERVADKLHQLYLNGELDVIESPEMGAECLEYIKKYHDVPVICKLHTSFEIWAEFNETTLPEEVHRQLVNWEREYIEKADSVISCTNLLYQMMLDRKQIKRSDVKIIGNPINSNSFKPLKNVVKNESILYLGGLEQRKGVLVLARAIPIVLEKHPSLIFRFIGSDTNSNDKNISTIDYIKQIVPNKYWKNLDFLGHIDNIEVNKYCNQSIIGVIPSAFDNLPYVAFEEILSGLPIIASDNTGVIEMIENNKSGIIFENKNEIDLANKIIYLYENPGIRKSIIKEGIKTIKTKFDSKSIALQNLDIYYDAINKFYINKNIKNVKQITRMPYGVANYVYKIDYLDTNKSSRIMKFYLDKNKAINNQTIIYYKDSLEFIEKKGNVDENKVLYLEYYEGNHKNNYTDVDYKIIFDFINYFHTKKDEPITLKEKISKFSNFYTNENYEKEIIVLKEFWQTKHHDIEVLLKDNLVLSHGDLSRTNIIFNDHQVAFIDFDEVCLAPKYYDLAVLSIKMCLDEKGCINSNLFNKIKNNYQTICDSKIDNEEYMLTILVYLYKILTEKFYWNALELIDLENNDQKKDYYLKYFNAFDKLYTEYQKSNINYL